MAKSAPPPGTSDIYPDEMPIWYRFEDTAKKIFSLYGYGELRTPIIEYTEVFQRGLGDETEVVQKEMYSFEDRGGRSLTMRPEGTAGVMRSLAGTDVMNGNEKRVFYMGPMFRGERPAKGRRRQFHQIGVECAGRVAPEVDAECIAMLMHYLEELKITGSKLLINTRGVHADRKPAEDALRAHFTPHIEMMCDDCKQRINKNIWRILDCKSKSCQQPIADAPEVVSFFSDESKQYFETVCKTLDVMGIDYVVDPTLVRGLDYYVHTVFEILHEGLGEQSSLALAGGGRYEVTVPDSKKPVVGVGFATGLERLQMIQEALGVDAPAKANAPVFLVSQSDEARPFNLGQAAELRKAGIPVIVEVEKKSMKAQMRAANRNECRFAVITGESELEAGIVVCKDMENREQVEVPVAELADYLKKYF